ncbi:lipid II flippase Amj family protein [candidate division KSB1 bacterium]
MSNHILIVIVLTFIIHLISTLSYSVRIVGVRTGRIFVSFSLFNIMVLISRTSNAFQAPLLEKTVESNILAGKLTGNAMDFHLILAAASVSTLAGAALIPTFQRIFSKAVDFFSRNRSVARLVLKLFTRRGVEEIEKAVTLPSKEQMYHYKRVGDLPKRVLVMNVFAVAIWTVGVLASLYAGYFNPELRGTSIALSGIINGAATIMMFVVIDPYLAAMTDDVIGGVTSEAVFRRFIFYLIFGRFLGTILAQALLIPAAHIIITVAEML